MIGGVCGYTDGNEILKNINFKVSFGEVLCILGANGAGKSTLFKSILGLTRLRGGRIEINGEDIRTWPRARIAQTIGYMPQSNNPPFSFGVMDMILMGRTAYLGLFASPSKSDILIAEQVVIDLGIESLADKKFLHLSGGEKQLVLIARALAQEPQILVMDEPTAGLDFGNQQMILNKINTLSARGHAIIMASHFPDHAFLYSSRVLILKDKGVYAYGDPWDVINERCLKELYRVETKIIETGLSNNAGKEIKVCVPLY
ncbi:MAG: ABC transporter ATP-binding protein [Synergistaceae bacterium]|nr:ABC transporter ATP-binding protein [Synergistaceae bacterium]